jgi:Uma2 family endonuclease
VANAHEPILEPDLSEIPVPDVSGLITENDAPVDDILSEKQMRLLTEPLYTAWSAPLPDGEARRFLLAANVGVFPTASNEALVPDVFLALDTVVKQPLTEKRNRSYFIWEHGKPPDVVIEIVSNREGNELTRKLRGYERIGVSHYVVFDPWRLASDETLMWLEMRGGALQRVSLPMRLPRVDLGLELWRGSYEGQEAEWLRWCLADGTLIPTGAERAESEKQRAESEKQRAESERQRADRLAAKLRELGIEIPDD